MVRGRFICLTLQALVDFCFYIYTFVLLPLPGFNWRASHKQVFPTYTEIQSRLAIQVRPYPRSSSSGWRWSCAFHLVTCGIETRWMVQVACNLLSKGAWNQAVRPCCYVACGTICLVCRSPCAQAALLDSLLHSTSPLAREHSMIQSNSIQPGRSHLAVPSSGKTCCRSLFFGPNSAYEI
jgi:hypothetical protein